MYSNVFESLPGVGAFSIINYLMNIVVIVGALGIILVGVAPIDLFVVPEEITNLFDNENIALALIAFAMILSSAGALLCTNVLNQFNHGLGQEYQEYEYES